MKRDITRGGSMTETETVLPAEISGLCHEARDLWTTLIGEFPDLSEIACHTLLVACQSLDRRNAARQALESHGLTFADRFGAPHARPEVAVERDCQALFLKSLRQLSQNLPARAEGPIFSRMGRIYHAKRREREA
jgi:hypothetical protein